MASPFGITVANNRLPACIAALPNDTLRGLERQRDALTGKIRANVHVVTGYMRDHVTAGTAQMRNKVATTTITSAAPYSAAEELGHHLRNGVWWEGHHKIEEAVVRERGNFVDGMAAAIHDSLARSAA